MYGWLCLETLEFMCREAALQKLRMRDNLIRVVFHSSLINMEDGCTTCLRSFSFSDPISDMWTGMTSYNPFLSEAECGMNLSWLQGSPWKISHPRALTNFLKALKIH
jgi:hypothetical protein